MGLYKSVHRLSTPHDLSHKGKQGEFETDILKKKRDDNRSELIWNKCKKDS